MEWFVYLAPVPNGAVEFNVGNGAVLVAALAVAFAPVVLALRRALGLQRAEPEAPQLHVIEGGKELRRHAA